MTVERQDSDMEIRTTVCFTLNDSSVSLTTNPIRRLSKVLREELGLPGTKVGCDAGDCGACTILLNDEPVCACLVPVGRLDNCRIDTVEGLAKGDGDCNTLQQSFLRHGAAQCGICIPGMLMAATALLKHNKTPNTQEVEDALGGVLCRCTGYRKIVAAVKDAAGSFADEARPDSGAAVGSRVSRLDGIAKVNGTEIFAADEFPQDALEGRIIRSPHHRAAFEIGDLDAFVTSHLGIVQVFTADDVPGDNCFGVIPEFADQPVFAEAETRFRGEAVAMVVGTPLAIQELDVADFPIRWQALEAMLTPNEARAANATTIHHTRGGNILTDGFVKRGEIDDGFAMSLHVEEDHITTGFIEHAYIEPEAAYAVRVNDRIEIYACTQAPFMDLFGIAKIMNLDHGAIRIVPTAVGGGFGSKLDLSVQPYVAIAAWHTNKPVRINYSRTDSMMSTTKRHSSEINVKVGVDKDGKLSAMKFDAVFNTGAYSSWGPTVANRVPVHASGPYYFPHYHAHATAVHTNCVPAGAFRGFGVPQAAIVQETVFDKLAIAIGMDRLEFRLKNAFENGLPTGTGQVFETGVGFKKCLRSLEPAWQERKRAVANFNATTKSPMRRGVGIAGVWYGCGNTSLPNPSTIKVGVDKDGKVILFQGAIDIGQGSNTVIPQIFADAVGLELATITLASGDTDQTPDAGKTSASRQTFISGKAAYIAGRQLRKKMLALAKATDDADLKIVNTELIVTENEAVRTVPLDNQPEDQNGFIFSAEGTYDPPTVPLDENGQGEPYATFGYGAQIVEIEVDTLLGTIKVTNITAAHDVGRAINPTLVEGQVEGGIAQGIGMALMEEYVPGRTDNLHDYLIPTIGDIPDITTLIIEEADPHGPFGAKGLGEHVMIPTCPAIICALHDATGAWLRELPATPARVHEAIKLSNSH